METLILRTKEQRSRKSGTEKKGKILGGDGPETSAATAQPLSPGVSPSCALSFLRAALEPWTFLLEGRNVAAHV